MAGVGIVVGMVDGVARVLDREGRVLVVRDLTGPDLGAVRALFEGLSPRSARQRFLCTSELAGPRYVEALADRARTLDAVVVLKGSQLLGVGSTHAGPGGTTEFAVAVEDGDQGHGLGTLLVEALVARSRRRGLSTLSGTVLGGNSQMLDVLAHLGLPCRTVVEDGTVGVTLTISSAGSLQSAHSAREESARAAAVRRLLQPGSVAVLDAPQWRRHDRAAVTSGPCVATSRVLRVDGGYDLVDGVDLAVVPDLAEDAGAAALACAEAGARVIALVHPDEADAAAGEGGPPVMTRELLDRVRGAGSRVLGPGATCLVNTDPQVALHVGGPEGRVVGGVVGLVGDEGHQLAGLVEQLGARGLGTSVAVDVGAAADLGVVDVVAWLARDHRTEVVVVALGGEAPPELVRHLGRVHETRKPVILLAGGGAVGSDSRERPVRAQSVEDVVDLASLLAQRGELPGRRAVVVTNEPLRAGAAAQRQLAQGTLLGPDLTQHSEMRIHFLAPGAAARGPVLALPAAATREQVHDVLETLADDPGVDSVVVDLVPEPGRRGHGLDVVLRGLPAGGSGGRPAALIVAVDPRRSRRHRGVPAVASVGAALDLLARTSQRQR